MPDPQRRSLLAVVLALVLAMLLTSCGTAAQPASQRTGPPSRASGTSPASSGTDASQLSSAPAPARPTATSTRPAATTTSTPGAPTATSTPATTAPGPAPEELPPEWGIAFLSPEGGVTVLGTLDQGAAWSTIKVPLAVAALREQETGVSAQSHAALSWSDNAAAWQLWSGLGPPGVAGAAVDAVLRSLGDTATTTQTQQVQAPFSPFGQTTWTLEGQVRTVQGLSCADEPAATAVLDSMGQVVPEQAWGLGRLDGAHFKGGWGPGPDGRYLVRQLGLVHVDGRPHPVALAARAGDGSFASGTAALDLLAGWWADSLVQQAAPSDCAGDQRR